MEVKAINTTPTNQKNKYNMAKLTGYTTLGCGIGCGITGAKKQYKIHKLLAYATIAMAAIHTIIIELHHKTKKQNK